MRSSGVLNAAVLCLLFACAAGATPCPSAAPARANYSMAVKPDAPKVGQTLNVTLDPAVPEPFTVCVNGDIVAAKNISVTTTTQFEFDAPGNSKGGNFFGAVSVIAAGAAYNTEIGTAPLLLRSVMSVPLGAGNGVFHLLLNGEGFNSVNKSYNKIQLNDYPLEVCWSDSECAARNLTVRGDVLSSGRVIDLTGLDPTDERSARFRVWVNGKPTEERRDTEASWRYWLALGIAALGTLAVIGIIVRLVRTLPAMVIDRDSYVYRALFVDKETNTYSLSKLQFYIWTIAAVFGYVYLAISKNYFQHVFGLPPVPSGLPGIVGLAGGTAVGAQIVTNMNGPKGAGELKPSLSDFVTSGGVVAADRVQFLVWTVIGAVGFLLAVTRLDPRVLRELPDIPSSLLAISGLSSFGYLGGKLARDPGPVINESMVSIGPDPDVPPSAAAPVNFGRIELRGRTLSRDANFRVSPGEESTANDIDISFDQLQPTVKDDQHVKKPRIIEKDPDSTDPNMAKRLLLVINLGDKLRPVFATTGKHTLTIINPDSQKAVFQFQVPESQKPV